MTTPMLQQFKEIKEKVPDAIIFFRLGDFYEMFGDDAEIAAPILEIALTARDAGKGSKIPMCGVPHHAVDSYLPKLVLQGYKVAICEQIEDPKNCKGIVKRDIVRIVTPGTLLDTNSFETKNNYLAGIYKEKEWGLAYIDITTGDFKIFQTPSLEIIQAELNRINPSEVLLPKGFTLKIFSQFYVNEVDKIFFQNTSDLQKRFQNQAVLFKENPVGEKAAAGLWKYLSDSFPDSQQDHIIEISGYQQENVMILDICTRRNLELVESIRTQDKKGTLFSVLNKTKTAVGARLLRHWIEQPLLKKEYISARMDCVEELIMNSFLHKDLQKELSYIYDLERLIGKMSYGKANGKDFYSLGNTLGRLPKIINLIIENKSKMLSSYIDKMSGLEELSAEIIKAINPACSTSIKDGNILKEGYSSEVDNLRLIASGGREWIARLENDEKERTKIRTLKIGYNRIFGYYIEITNSNRHLVPDDYIRKQTLANAERYITPELKEYEHKVITAQEQLKEIEYNIFMDLKQQVLNNSAKILTAAQALAEIDVFVSLAEVAIENNYVRPEIRNDGIINIKDGRHPVVELMSNESQFVPNDILLTPDKHLALLTGPNMAGKSTFMRQVALIVLMAQIGSFVPAQKAAISLVDSIFTRVGASDDLASGQSTFMVEMKEVSYILKNATKNSLIILDEVGRGTATYDGLSLAWAISEYILQNNNLKSKTLFATHYHELTDLEDHFTGITNLHVVVKENGEDIVFLHKIMPGKADRSYGLHVAKIAGLPPELLKRAAILLKDLESTSNSNKSINVNNPDVIQPVLFEIPQIHPIIKEIGELKVDEMSPRQALDYIYDLVNRIKSSQIL